MEVGGVREVVGMVSQRLACGKDTGSEGYAEKGSQQKACDQGTGHGIRDTGKRDTGNGIPVTGYRVRDTRHGIPDAGH